MGTVKRAGDLLSTIFSEHINPVSLERGRISANLLSSWAIIAEETEIPAVSDHSRIRDVDHGIVVIEAEHPGWVQILQTKQDILLKSFQRKFPKLNIHGLSFYLSRDLIKKQAQELTRMPEADAPLPKPEQPKPATEPPHEKNEALHESITEFRKMIQKRNRKN
jgi:hypothetical protein